ncbi:MAG TPA: hypothetical protein DDW88_06860 [Treponema sp.]|nr:hypothetical protein [Treponema sp.]
MKLFLDEFKVLNMSELLVVNGSYGGTASGSGYSSSSSGYSTSSSSVGSSSKVPAGYSALTGWLPGWSSDGYTGPGTTETSANTAPKKDVNPLGNDTVITGEYGSEYLANDNDIMDLHTGIDMVSNTREVSSVKTGKVVYAGEHPDGTSIATGTLVIIKYDDGNYGLYGHMDPKDLDVKAGDSIGSGSSLGTYYNGMMGKSSGGHLHYSEFSGNVTATGDDLARLFNRTGYCYDQGNVLDDPTGQKLWNGLTVVKPNF